MIYKIISENDFINEFKSFSEGYANKFSIDGLRALYTYLYDITGDSFDEMRENIELDVIALCCDYTEYESFEEFQNQYPDIKDFEELNNHTTVIEVDNAMKTDNFIIANF